MATVASIVPLVGAETLDITIDQKTKTAQVDIIPGTKDGVNFLANRHCEVRFKNPKVFGRENLLLKKGKAEGLKVDKNTDTTTFEIWISPEQTVGMPVQPIAEQVKPDLARGPWPILP